MKAIYMAVLATAGLVCASSASADTGFYLGATLGQSSFSSPDDQINIGAIPFTKSKTDTAFGVRVGYGINENFAIEGGYIDLGKQVVSFYNDPAPAPNNSNRRNSMSAKGVALSVVGKLPVSDNFLLIGKLGVSRLTNRSVETNAWEGVGNPTSFDNSDTSTKPTYGIGVQYKLTPQISLLGEIEHFEAKAGLHTVDLKVNLFSAGLQYQF